MLNCGGGRHLISEPTLLYTHCCGIRRTWRCYVDLNIYQDLRLEIVSYEADTHDCGFVSHFDKVDERR